MENGARCELLQIINMRWGRGGGLINIVDVIERLLVKPAPINTKGNLPNII